MNQNIIDLVTPSLSLTQPYTSVTDGGVEVFTRFADLDGDGSENIHEYDDTVATGGGPTDYALAASDAAVTPADSPGCLDGLNVEDEGATFFTAVGLDWNTVDADQDGTLDRDRAMDFFALLCDADDPDNAAANAAYEANRDELRQETTYEWMFQFEGVLSALMTSSQGYIDIFVDVFSLSGSYAPY